MKFLISFFLFVILSFQLISASQYYSAGGSQGKEGEQPGHYSEEKVEHPVGNKYKDGKHVSSTISLTVPTLFDSSPSTDDLLSFDYYQQRCPQAESIINRKVQQWFYRNYTVAANLLRLHFHDCSVRGCDGSILLNHEGSEKTAQVSKTLKGFEVIDDIKAELERECPQTVSCADILTSAARDATVLLGGPFWIVPYGRKDGKVSVAQEAALVPAGYESISTLIEFYQSIDLNIVDLVVLSGAHTIGRATCGSIHERLYNYKGTGKPDPTIDPKYLNYLTRKCGASSKYAYYGGQSQASSQYADLDGVTPKTFDNEYYKNLQKDMGLLSTDQLLFSDPRTAPIVSALASQPDLFYYQFGVSMTKLGNILFPSVIDDGEIRSVCSSVNSYHY